ncbi:unnamed protein product [Anisakis simplex]|uniref:Transcriptional regulator n=1 Tax=Anisakis simplex TaxID=6269 RepID=A0A0M3KFP2_ANISI|nr:unnamed protein product [Anisakis simplex]
MSELRSRGRTTALRDVDEGEALVESMLPEGHSPKWLRAKDRRMPAVEPTGQFERFSETRARRLLNELADLGPRVSGSRECEVGIVGWI